MIRLSGSRVSAVFFAATLLGIVAVGTASTASASGMRWTETGSPTTSFIPPFSSTTPGLEQAGNHLFDVSCISQRFCVAVGVVSNSTDSPTLVEEWDGRRWIVSPGSSVAGETDLVAVSCTSTTFCVAVGNTSSATGGGGHTQPIIETFNGTAWRYTLLDPFPTNASSQLRDVSCTSPTFCVAVGFTTNGSGPSTMVEAWHGRSWSVVASPNAGPVDSLTGVSCRNAEFCFAVGSHATLTGAAPSIERWNGSIWSRVPSAATGSGTFGQLAGVSCANSRFCMAAGSLGSGPLVETWHGAAWSIVRNPPPRPGFSQHFAAVSCPGSHHCVAPLDEAGPTPGSDGAVVQEWNGTTWSVGTGQPTTSGVLSGVSCSGERFCFAVGGSHYFPHGSVALRGK